MAFVGFQPTQGASRSGETAFMDEAIITKTLLFIGLKITQ